MDEIHARSTTLSFEEARGLVEEHASTLHRSGKELTELLSAVGMPLAEPIFADRDFPPFARAARDGYALRSADLKGLPVTLDVIAEIKAGASSQIEIGASQAASIMTGAASPAGADAIVMVEHTLANDHWVQVSKAVLPGENIVPAGCEARRGEKLLHPGARLEHAAIAVAASVGRSHVLVYSKPRIAILATGDEIVDIAIQPGPNQIRNSNSYSLAAQVQAAGGDPILLPIAPDEPLRLRELIAEGLQLDLLLISGGVSMGKYDLVERVLEEFNAEIFFSAVQIQPGRPTVFGRVERKYFLGLPGNPLSTMVTFELFARPLVEALSGRLSRKLVFQFAKLKSDIKTKIGLKRFLPALLSGEFEHSEVELVKCHGSGDIAAAARANCYIVVPADRDRLGAGEWVPLLMR